MQLNLSKLLTTAFQTDELNHLKFPRQLENSSNEMMDHV